MFLVVLKQYYLGTFLSTVFRNRAGKSHLPLLARDPCAALAAYFLCTGLCIEEKLRQPWPAIAQRFCSIGIYGGDKMAKKERFKTVYSQGTLDVVQILEDTETGVNYVFHKVANAGGMTLLLDKDGKPVISPPVDKEL